MTIQDKLNVLACKRLQGYLSVNSWKLKREGFILQLANLKWWGKWWGNKKRQSRY